MRVAFLISCFILRPPHMVFTATAQWTYVPEFCPQLRPTWDHCFRRSCEIEQGHFEGFPETIPFFEVLSQISSNIKTESDIAHENIVSGRNLDGKEDLSD